MASQVWGEVERAMVQLERVLVVGGGLAGLAAGISLREAGFAVEVVEARAVWPAEGAAITLHANGVRALRRLGVGEGLDAASAPVPRWRFHNAGGELLCVTDLDELWHGVDRCRGITRADLQRLLVQQAATVPCRLGTAVTTLNARSEVVEVGFSDHTCGRYDLVVGADGVGSMVRRIVMGDVAPRALPALAWRSVIDGRPGGVSDLDMVMGEGCFFGLVPVGGGRTYGFAGAATQDYADPLVGRLDRFSRRFGGLGGPVPDYLSGLKSDHDLHSGPIRMIDLDIWHRGRIVLLGDAAHATPPHMGEGGSLAVEDAQVLAASLREETSIEASLNAYEHRRRPRVNWVRDQSIMVSKIWTLPPELRDAALRASGAQMLWDRYAPLRAEP